MKPRTDYAVIAGRYDHDRSVYSVAADPEVTANGGPVVDVGCGTGTWLAAQDVPVAIGVDPSAAMLAHCTVPAVQSRAESLPLATGCAAWLECRFCFHHFDDERAFLREAHRLLVAGGVLRLVNVMPLEDDASLLYDLFPEARAVDALRFPRSEQLVEWMTAAGFHDVTIDREVATVRRPRDEFVDGLRSRTISQLALLDDDAFGRGLARAEQLGGDVTDVSTVWTFRARR